MTGLLEHVLAFGRALREGGLPVTSGRIAHFLEALAHVAVGDRGDVREAGRTTLAASRADLERFDAIFDRFWQGGRAPGPPGPPEPPPLPPPLLPAEVAIARRLSAGAEEPPQPLADRSETWSAAERLRRKRFDRMTPEELREVAAQFGRERWPLLERRTRRYRAAAAGARPDWRRTMRSAIRHEGELVVRHFRARATRPRPLVVLADVSGSMERYSRVVLAFVHALSRQSARQARSRPLEAFVFGTRLTRVTRALQARQLDAALDAIAARVPDWAGGTRIGEALHAFNQTWTRRVLGRGATLLIVSDGWDQGDPARIAHEMDRLRLSCGGLVWLNPVAATDGYEPRTRALVAALPHVDAFLPAGTLAQLADAGRAIAAATR